jgi:hypothetical protein
VRPELDTRAEENPGRGLTYALLISLVLIIGAVLIARFV